MDIAAIQEAIGLFKTVVDAVVGLFQGFPKFIEDFAQFFEPTSDAADAPTYGEKWAEDTANIFKPETPAAE